VIQNQKGRSHSVRSKEDLLDELRRDVSRLNPDELETFKLLLEELQQPSIPEGERILDVLQGAEYEREPVDVETFIMDEYFLGKTCAGVYPKWLEALKELFSGGYNEAVFTGAIGTGKTFAASIGVCRLLYELSCLRDPCKSLGLAPGSTISIANMSVNETLARKVVFENIGAKIKASPYFSEHFKYEDTQKEMRFPKHVWLTARATTDHSVLGMNLISAILDETNFMHKNEGKKTSDGRRYGMVDQAESLYTAMKRRMKSRFEKGGKLPGMLFVVSSKQTNDDFTARRIREAINDPHVLVRDFSLWDVKPSHYSDKKFFVLCGNESIPSRVLDEGEESRYSDELTPENCVLIEVPEDFRADFESDLEGSIRDIAGVATVSVNPYIQRRDKISVALRTDREHPFSVLVYDPSRGGSFMWDRLVDTKMVRGASGMQEPAWKPRLNPDAPRHVHIDPSLRGDATGFCMSHISGYKQVLRRAEDGRQFAERAPVYTVDLVLQIVPPIGGEIVLGELRHLVYDLSAHGFMITCVSLDSWNSADTIQQMKQRGYRAEVQSVDITPEPYDNLKTALYEDRIVAYEYSPLQRELETLQEDRRGNRRKIDHPPSGSKDIADALAGCLFTLSKRSVNQPLPIIQHSSYAQDPWMPEQQQAVLAGMLDARLQETLPPIMFGTSQDDSWVTGGGRKQ